jgi:hypothetical protein
MDRFFTKAIPWLARASGVGGLAEEFRVMERTRDHGPSGSRTRLRCHVRQGAEEG